MLRTSWGDPDLQGIWVSNSPTPLERPSALADRDRLTDEEVATLQARADRIFSNGRSAFATGGISFGAALENVDTFDHPQSTSNSLGMIDFVFDNRTSMVVDPPDGRIPPLTPGGRRRTGCGCGRVATQGRPGGLQRDSSMHHDRCATAGWQLWRRPYSYYQILQTPGYVVLVMEAFHDVRIIPTRWSVRHLPEGLRQWNGDSRGRWEGDTLVVETRNFSLNSYFRGAADGLHLVERVTRAADDTLTYRMTFTDATTWATSWIAEMPLRGMDEAIYEFACHEGNHSLATMLMIARHEEAVADGRRPPN